MTITIKRKKRVLYLCTGNSCRSQMAEAITNHQLGEVWSAVSAGTEPAGYVHPRALQVLGEIDIEHKGASKAVTEFQGQEFDLVVTVCDDARETCPVWLGKEAKEHLGFRDPAQANGTEKEILKVFREVRNQIQSQVPALLAEHTEED